MGLFSKLRHTERSFLSSTSTSAQSAASTSHQAPPLPIEEKKTNDFSALSQEQAREQFWTALRAKDVNGVAAVLAPRPAPERRNLTHAPQGGSFLPLNPPEPQRPLCVAAFSGPLEMCMALLEKPGAHPRLGDKVEGSPALNALFWAAFAGHIDIMDYLHDSQGLDAKEVLLAVGQNPSKDNIRWLRKRDLPISAFHDSLRKAVEFEHIEAMQALIWYGEVSPNLPVAAEADDAGDGASYQTAKETKENKEDQSVLCWAISNNKLDAAQALVDVGANVNGLSGSVATKSPEFDAQPVCLAMARYGDNNGEQASMSLLIKLLRRNASVNSKHLTKAMGYKKPFGTQLFKALLLNSDAAPITLSEANSLLKVAGANNLFSVQVILAELALMLQKDISWPQSEAKANDPALHFVALARERVLEYIDTSDDDVDPDLLEASGAWDSEGQVGATTDLSLRRGPKTLGEKIKGSVKAPRMSSASAPGGQLVKTKKKSTNLFS